MWDFYMILKIENPLYVPPRLQTPRQAHREPALQHSVASLPRFVWLHEGRLLYDYSAIYKRHFSEWLRLAIVFCYASLLLRKYCVTGYEIKSVSGACLVQA